MRFYSSEVISYDTLPRYLPHLAREKGLIRKEGKNYEVQTETSFTSLTA